LIQAMRLSLTLRPRTFTLAKAQQNAPQTASPQACTAIDADAARLACYDQALGYTATDTQAADQAAELAKAERELKQSQTTKQPISPATVRNQLGDFFKNTPENPAIANAGKGSLLDRRWELAKDSKLGTFHLRAYKPVYLLPMFWTSDKYQLPTSPNLNNTVSSPQSLDSSELKFQISLKTKVAENLFDDNGDLWVGYTQSSRWQAYNAKNSRPFRETNYEPEAMLVFRNNYHIGDWRGRMSAISLNHQSNGRTDPLSRSWNRVILNFGLDRENWALVLRPWFRIKEDAADDNNSDIEDYMGRGDATLVYSRNGHELALMARHSLRTGDRSHGALQFDWGFPISNQLRGHLQVFDGYGESLIDYNHKATYIGLGVSLLEWF
jgi:phospholipase A1